MSFAYHWSPQQIDASPAIECLGHLILIRRCEASNKMFACTAACFADLDPGTRKAITKTLTDEIQAGRRRLTEYEVADPQSRITMIGTALRVHGQRWAEKHPAEIGWLASQRVSQEEAIARSAAWEKQVMSDEFWE